MLKDEMTAQEVFDHVVNHLFTQASKSEMRSEEGVLFCCYRGNNKSCAVGCLIADEEYSPKMERKKIVFILENMCFYDIKQSLVKRLNPHRTLLEDLQRVHDNFYVEDWRPQLVETALNHKLTFNGPSTSIERKS